MNVLVSGSTGLIGSAAVSRLSDAGHKVTRLVRDAGQQNDAILWDPQAGTIDREDLAGFGAVIHLAGENIAGRRWKSKQKQLIRDSRVAGTRLLAETLADLQDPPPVFACASAIGYYGDRADELLDEHSPPGQGFLPDLCRDWEAAADPLVERGVRVVHLRFGVVLSGGGGALAKMLTPFKLCVGGKIGNGRQYWSWVHLNDVAGAIVHVLERADIAGPVNVTAPQPATNKEFTQALGRVLRRPTILPMPGIAARLLLGEMADALLLASARVLPRRLQASGYEFHHPELQPALHACMRKAD